MTQAKTYTASWRSDKSEARFRRIDTELWASSEAKPVEEHTADTRFGTSHVYRWPGEGTPLVFLHGMADTSRRWASYAAALSDRDVYAIDVMGEVGRSEQRAGFTSSADYGTWLDDTLASLGLDDAHLVGWSLGGYVALEQAAQFPGRASSLLLFEPVGLAPLRLGRLMWWSTKAALASLAPSSLRDTLADRIGQPVLKNNVDMRLVGYGQRHHPPASPPIEPLDESDLRRITSPVHVVAGAKSQAFDTDVVVERIRDHIPHATVDVIADAGHAIALTHFEHCLSKVRALA